MTDSGDVGGRRHPFPRATLTSHRPHSGRPHRPGPQALPLAEPGGLLVPGARPRCGAPARRSGDHTSASPLSRAVPPDTPTVLETTVPLTREQARNHQRALDLVVSNRELPFKEREFVLDHYQPSASTTQALEGAYFTPPITFFVAPQRGHRPPGPA